VTEADICAPSIGRDDIREPASGLKGKNGSLMQPVAVTLERSSDLASTTVTTMRQLGVMGLPRNYEIFYEALSGSNPQLSLAVVALSSRPTQDELDAIGRKFFAQNHGHGIVEQARDILARELEEVASLLRSEHSHIEKYGRILDETSDGLSSRNAISRELLQKIVGAISVATVSTIDHGKQVVSTLADKSAELESVKSKLEEYKRLADTDPLTQVWNRRAFDKEIAAIYNSNKGILFNALILADIDRFKDINDRFGHPVGDKIIRNVADILQTSTHAGTFVARTGGEEFALIVEGASEETTCQIAERIRVLVEQTTFASGQNGASYGTITLSMGVCMASEADGPEDLYTKADQALYRSKMSGRNRVTRHSSMAGQSGKNWLLYKKD
jgi:diguanylate cyclase